MEIRNSVFLFVKALLFVWVSVCISNYEHECYYQEKGRVFVSFDPL